MFSIILHKKSKIKKGEKSNGKFQSNKKALFMSMLSLLLCFTMLMGATFAWFTDTVTSSNNKIQAGTLKVDLELLDKETGNWNSIKDSKNPIFNYNNWEPGYVDVKVLKIENEGTLALKWFAKFVSEVELSKLANVIDVYVLPSENELVYLAGRNLDGYTHVGTAAEFINTIEDTTRGELAAGKAAYLGIALKMQESAGDEYQELTLGEFDIQILATQLTAEEDSFDDQYDKDADFDGQISGGDSLKAAVEKGGDYQIISDVELTGEVTVSENVNLNLNMNSNAVNGSVINEGTLTINGDGGAINAEGAGLENFGTATLTDVDMNAGSPSDYSNISREDAVTTYNDVDIISGGGGIGASDGAKVIFNSGSVAVNSTSTSGRYIFYAEGTGTEITINGGTFSFSTALNQKRAYIYAGEGTTVYVNGGTFGKASTRNDYKAGIRGTGEVIIKGGTFGFDPTNWVAEGYVATEQDGKWTVVKGVLIENQTSLDQAIADGEQSVYLAAGSYTMPEKDLRGKTLTVSGTKDTIIDVSNIDARNQFVTGATLEFDGVTLNFGKVNYMGFANTKSLTYKNCKINGLQFLFGENVAFENCELDSNGAEHCVWTYGVKNVNFTGCEFTYSDRGINCYSDNDVVGGKQTVNFTNCKFATENAASAGAVEINSSFFSVGIEVNLTGCTAPSYGELAYVSPWDSGNGAKTTINIK